jgi:hypothetical protein
MGNENGVVGTAWHERSVLRAPRAVTREAVVCAEPFASNA